MKASDILGFKDLRTKKVKVREWNCELTIKELDLDKGLKLLSMAEEKDGKVLMTAEDVARVVIWGVVNDDGDPVFSEDDVEALSKKSHRPLMFLYQEIARLSDEGAAKN